MHTKKKVLIVDDEKSIVSALCLKCRMQGLEPVGCYNGAEALKYMNEEQFDLIVLDIYMPIKDGITVLKEKKQTQNRDTVVYIQTAYGYSDDFEEVKRLGAKHFYVKSSMSMADVIASIKKELAIA